MKPNVPYIVTKASDDGTFEVGDHITLCDDGGIACIEAQGWIEKCDVAEAIVGMEFEIDNDRIERRKSYLREALKRLEA